LVTLASQRRAEVWTPAQALPAVRTDRPSRHPQGAPHPFPPDLATLFRPI